MSDIQAKIDELEAEMARTQKNKATNYHLGRFSEKPLLKLCRWSTLIRFSSFCRDIESKDCQTKKRTDCKLPGQDMNDPSLFSCRSQLINVFCFSQNGPGGKSAGSKDAGRGFDVTKSGDTRIGLVGWVLFL